MILSSLLLLFLVAQSAPDTSASVSGRVVDAGTGRPIPGVVVTLDGSAVVTTTASPLSPRALTNGQGEFVIRGLQKGKVHFIAVKSGYVTASFNQRRPGGAGQGLAIDDRQRLSGVDIRMWRHASVSGTVVDEAGEPAVGVRVQVFQRSFVAGHKRFATGPAAVTDDRGIYRVANLTPGDYTVGVLFTQDTIPTEVTDVFFGGGNAALEARVERELHTIGSEIVPQGSPSAMAVGDQILTLPAGTLMPHANAQGGLLVYPTVFYPAAASLAQAGVVTLRSGEERGSIDLAMHPSRTARVSGTIVAPDGPAANVGVLLSPAAADDVVSAIGVATTMTSGSGGFTFPAVPAGQYVLKVLRVPPEPVDESEGSRARVMPGGGVTIGTAVGAPGGPPASPPVPADATLYAQVPVSVGETDVTGLVVPLAAAPRITGRVEFEGTAEKPVGSALTRVRISLDPADGSRLPHGLSFEVGHPDEDGRFRTVGVPPGKYVMRLNQPGGWILKGVFLGASDLSDVPFDLTAKDLSGVVITFTDRPATLTGTVRSEQSGDPDAVVLAFPTDAAAWTSRGALPRRMRIGRTERDGTYTITGLPAGEYHVVAIHEDAVADWQDPALLEALARVARQVRIVEGERRSENLTPAVIR